MDGLATGGEDRLAGYKQGGLPSVAFIHHQDDVEKTVEHPLQGLNRHPFRSETALCYGIKNKMVYYPLIFKLWDIKMLEPVFFYLSHLLSCEFN